MVGQGYYPILDFESNPLDVILVADMPVLGACFVVPKVLALIGKLGCNSQCHRGYGCHFGEYTVGEYGFCHFGEYTVGEYVL